MNGASSTQTDVASTQVLKRERKDLSDEVQRIGRLPVPSLESTSSLPLIATLRGEECAYLEIYWAAKDMISRHYEAHPHDIGLHAAMADLRLVNRGFGPRLLPRIVASVFALQPRCERIMFDPDHRNTTVRRLCEYVGCRSLGEHDAPNRRMVLYALERPTQSS